ncbi:MAG: hypothetical protein MSH38_07140 [Eubacterium sp.]|nr:hypothetical protein [Eubacterium sp.]
MKRKLIALMFAIVFCLTSVVLPCLAVVDSESSTTHSHTDCGIEGCYIEGEHDHANSDTDDEVKEEIENIDLSSVADVNFSDDKKTVKVIFTFFGSSYNAKASNLEVSFKGDVLALKEVSGMVFGMNVKQLLSRKSDGTIVITHPVQDTNLYTLGGSLEITFDVKKLESSYVNIVGKAEAEEKSEKLIKHIYYVVGSAAKVAFCDHASTYTEDVIKATCLSGGMQRVKCRICGETIDIIDTPAADHDLPSTPARWIVARTCTTGGKAEFVCRTCKKIVIKEYDALGHNYVKEDKIGSDGLWHEVCTICHNDRRAEIQCEHSASDYELLVVTRKATCTEDGYGSYKCKKCGATAVITIKASHKYVYYSTKVAATKTSTGIDIWKCTVCGGTKEVETPKLADHTTHIWDTGTITEVATCTKTGKKVYRCTISGCTETKEEIIPLAAHTYGAWTIAGNPTCTQTGKRTRSCVICQHTEEGTIAAKGHSFGAWTTVTVATCAVDGLDRRVCSECNASETRTIDKATIACVYPESGYTVVTAATCVAKGVEMCTCSVCGKSVNKRDIPINPDAHSYGEWVVVTESTCITTGESKRTCALCGTVETKTVEASGHKFTDVSAKKGTTVRECSVCHMVETVKETKNGNIKSVKSNGYTLTLGGSAVADKDVFFNVRLMTNDEFNSKIKPFVDQINANAEMAKQYGTPEASYIYRLVIDGSEATLASGSELTIELGEEYKKTAFNVCYIDENGSLKTVSPDYIKRKGTTITINIGSGTFKYPGNSFVLFNTGAKTTNYVVPIVIVLLTLVIAAGVVMYILSKNKKATAKMNETNI